MINPLEQVVTVEFFGATRFARKMSCKFCGRQIYDLSAGRSQAHVDRETVGLLLHFALMHNIEIVKQSCEDPGCTKHAHS